MSKDLSLKNDLVECPVCGELVEKEYFIEELGLCQDCFAAQMAEDKPIDEPEKENEQ